jgi:hypothetical protein
LEKAHKFPIWHAGFHDRWIRDALEYRHGKSYIEQNPVAAGIAESPGQYPMSSASGQYVLDGSKFDAP